MTISLKDKIKNSLLSQYNLLFSNKDVINEAELKVAIERILNEIAAKEGRAVSDSEKETIIKALVDEAIGFGAVLDGLLKDPAISEIMINGPKQIYIEKEGKTRLSGLAFDDNQHLMHAIQRMLMPTHRRLDESMPFTDFCLPDGSRVNVIMSPVSLVGPVVTIRKFLKEIKTIEDLIKLNTMDKRIADLLVVAIKAKVNIIFSGATGAGKTTTLSVLSTYIPDEERIITIEDTPELRLNQEHIVRLQTKIASIEGKGEISIRDLFKNSLRMRPDRIILGEIRSGEALDMLQAICSGHTGSLAVVHAHSPSDVMRRIESMIMTSGVPISIEAVRSQIASALNLIVQQEQLQDGSRKVTHVAEVRGLRDGDVVVEDIFSYEIDSMNSQGKLSGGWHATGVKPLFFSHLKKIGLGLSEDIFKKD